MGFAVDSFSPHTATSAASLAQAGIVGALRYHYNISGREVSILHGAGIAIGLIAEFDTRTWHPPIDAPWTGPEHGQRAVQIAQAIGMPKGSAIWLTQDTDLTPAQYSSAIDYWDGGDDVIRSAGYRVGAYAETGLIAQLLDRGKADLGWEVGAYGWSGWQHSSRACLRQRPEQPYYGGVQVDLNDVISADCGWWYPPGVTAPAPVPAPTGPLPVPFPAKGNDTMLLGILFFKDKPDRWVLGRDRQGEWCDKIENTDELRILEAQHLPVFELGAGNDWLDATFKRLTGI